MDYVVQIGQFLLSLSLLIVLHEFGHYLPAKLFKTKVEKFFLFFDIKFALFQKKIGDTVYGIGWLPLGGYVKIAGMIDESMDTEAMAEEPKPWEFRTKPAWQRLIIMLGGVIVNFLIAWIIYIFITAFYGQTDIDTSSIKDGYHVSNPIFTEIGFKTGDNVVAINGTSYKNYSDIRANMIVADEVTIERDGTEQIITMPQDFLGKISDSDDRSMFELRIPFVVASIAEESPNQEVDIKAGDLITAIDGQAVTYNDEIRTLLENYKGQSVAVSITRDGSQITRELQITDDGKMGIYPDGTMALYEEMGLLEITRKEFGFAESVSVGTTKFVDRFSWYGQQLKKIFTPSTGAYKGVGGFYAILNIFPDYWSWEAFWNITALLSIMLGVLNLLPIPALDGGHVTFLLYEMVTGRKPGDKFMEYAQVVGFFIVIALVLFANGNDIYRAIFK